MKRFALVSLLALPLLAVSQQEAKAWTKIGIGASFHIGFETGGTHLCWDSDSGPCYGCATPCYGYGNNGLAYGAAPVPTAQAVTYSQSQVMPASWHGGYNGYGADYGYYPAYWYGR